MKIQTILMLLIGSVCGLAVYGADWQREQDDKTIEWQRVQDGKISNLDKLIVRQNILLEQQVRFNANSIHRVIYPASTSTSTRIDE